MILFSLSSQLGFVDAEENRRRQKFMDSAQVHLGNNALIFCLYDYIIL